MLFALEWSMHVAIDEVLGRGSGRAGLTTRRAVATRPEQSHKAPTEVGEGSAAQARLLPHAEGDEGVEPRWRDRVDRIGKWGAIERCRAYWPALSPPLAWVPYLERSIRLRNCGLETETVRLTRERSCTTV